MSTIDANSDPTLAELVAKAKLLMAIQADDTSLEADAIAVYADDSTLTSATVEVTDTALVCVDNSNGTNTFTFSNASYDTMAEMVTAIDAIDANWNATLLGKSDADTATLKRVAATDVLGQSNELTLLHENDALIELLITNIWKGIETGLMRELLSTSYTEIRHMPRNKCLALRHPEVSSVQRLMIEAEDGLKVEYTGSDTNATVEVTDTAVITRSVAGDTTTATTSLFTDNVTTSAMATTINALAGWTSSVINTRPSSFLIKRPSVDAKDQEITLSTWTEWDCDYFADYEEGLVEIKPYFMTWSPETGGRLRIDYTAGYSTMPADVELVLLEAVKHAWDMKGKDGSVKSERLGDYAYTLADTFGTAVQSSIGMAVEKLATGYKRVLP